MAFAQDLELRFGLETSWEETESAGAEIGLELIPDCGLHPQGYRLELGSAGVRITAATAVGLFYGEQTLIQLLQIYGLERGKSARIPGMVIEDHPDFPQRGVLLDISRNKVPSLTTLMQLVRLLGHFKINQLQLYTEHTFAYAGHEIVWQDASPLAPSDLSALKSFCQQAKVALVPNQNSLGHMHRWLIHSPYREFAECPAGVVHPFSPEPEPFSLCPVDPRSLDLLRDLYDQLLPHFSGELFNVGLDEPFDLGSGRSAAICRKRGRARVFLDFLRAVHGLARERGRRIQFWGDVVLDHPELIPELPQDAIALAWGYDAGHPFASVAERLAAAGLEFYVCPGTSSWNSFAGRQHNALLNLAQAAEAGVAHQAKGYLITDWGDHGHLQPLSVSYLGMAAGAGFAWNAASARKATSAPWARILDVHVFADRSWTMGDIVVGLGDIYRWVGGVPPNGSALFFLLFGGPGELRRRGVWGVTPERLELAREAIAYWSARLRETKMTQYCADRATILDEYSWVAEMLDLSCQVGALELSAQGYRRAASAVQAKIQEQLRLLIAKLPGIWQQRNRPGGLAGSLGRLERIRTRLLPF